MEKLEEKLIILLDQFDDLGIPYDVETLKRLSNLMRKRYVSIKNKCYFETIDELKKEVPHLEGRIKNSLSFITPNYNSFIFEGELILNNRFMVKVRELYFVFKIEKNKNKYSIHRITNLVNKHFLTETMKNMKKTGNTLNHRHISFYFND